jgi:SAM-dependent methyltransferase
VDAPCALCGSDDSEPRWTTPDRMGAVPGSYTVVGCRGCGFLYQRPRVRDEHLGDCYPDHYPRHQEPSPRVPFKGSPMRVRAVRCALARHFGYPGGHDSKPSRLTRLWAWWLARRLRWSCPPWLGQGRYLDVGCGSGASLGVARALGWRVAGVEVDTPAAERARRYTDEIYVGDVLSAPFASGSFDVVTAFHVLEHLTDPVRAARRMLEWLAPGGVLIIEVPNAGGLGARLFGRAWSGLELPRHLSHFTPETLGAAIARAGGHVAWIWHQGKPRHYIWSFRIWLSDRGFDRLLRFTERRFVYGVTKLLLELIVPLAALLRRGEVIRVGVRKEAAGTPSEEARAGRSARIVRPRGAGAEAARGGVPVGGVEEQAQPGPAQLADVTNHAEGEARGRR